MTKALSPARTPARNYIHGRPEASPFSGPGDRPVAAGRVKYEKKFGLEGERTIICANCGNPVTMPEFIISVDGRHVHTFTDPDGFAYEIGCFSSATGCAHVGEPVAEHSWFEGFRWGLSICSGCYMHLGWFYQGEKENFYGLIMDLISDAATP